MPSIRRANVKFLIDIDYLGGSTNNIDQRIADRLIAPFANGTGTSQANRAYQASFSIAASGTSTITLSSFTDNLGNSLALTKLRAIFISHASSSLATTGITIGGGTNPVFGTKISGIEVLPGDCFAFECKSGYAISSGSADRIRIVNADSSNTATGTITILGSQ